MKDNCEPWNEAENGHVHERLFDYVQSVESAQSALFDRFVKLACLYDPYDYNAGDSFSITTGSLFKGVRSDSNVQENLVARNVDSVCARLSTQETRTVFETDGGDWTQQRLARHLTWYAEGGAKLLDLDAHKSEQVKGMAIKGTGIVKIYTDFRAKKICAEKVLVDDIVVDEVECRSGPPSQMHRRAFVSRAKLIARFPEFEKEINAAQNGTGNISGRVWAKYRSIERDEVVVINSHKLPVGSKGSDYYVPGREVLCIDGCDLYDKPYEYEDFPYVCMFWSKRLSGWYGIGLAERIAGHQRALNKYNWQWDRCLDQHAVPTTYVRPTDAHLAVRTVNRIGSVVVVKGDIPQTVVPQAISPQLIQRHQIIHDSAHEETGESRMVATSNIPASLETGAAVREFRDQTTMRFASQEKEIEQCRVKADLLFLRCAKELGDDAPVIVRKSRWGARYIKWSDVDPGELKVMATAATTLSRTHAGRIQMAHELGQAGVISLDEMRRLIGHPDIERAMSLYTAALEDIERCIEDVLDGEVIVPEPYQNLKMGIWRFQMALLKARGDGAPEEILEGLRQWIEQAAEMIKMASAPPAEPQLMAPEGQPQQQPEAGPMPAPASEDFAMQSAMAV